MTLAYETDEDLATRPTEQRLPHVLMTIAGALGLAATFQLTSDTFTQLQNRAEGVETAFSCDFSAFVSCGGVMSSQQASVFGFENSLLGVIGFSIVLTLGVLSWASTKFARWVWTGLQVGVVFGIGFVTWLQYQSIYELEVLCPYCMVVWVVTIPLFVHVSAYNLRSVPRAAR